MAARRPFPAQRQSLQLANANILRSSVGVGLTWGSPFGALTVNYAVPVTKAAYDVVQPLQLHRQPVLNPVRNGMNPYATRRDQPCEIKATARFTTLRLIADGALPVIQKKTPACFIRATN